MTQWFGVYRVHKDGTHKFVSRTVTGSEKLAKELAEDLSCGRVVMPDGSIRAIAPFPHIAKPIRY